MRLSENGALFNCVWERAEQEPGCVSVPLLEGPSGI